MGSSTESIEHVAVDGQHDQQATLQQLALHRGILERLGCNDAGIKSVLDFGCGAGHMVDQYRQAGYDAYGCDLVIDRESEFLSKIQEQPYRLMYPDNLFDFVFSDQVLEHVQDHSAAFAEIRRVLKPGGVSLHIFPPKLKLVESHVFVPLAGAVQNRPWLLFWALMGIRNSFQQHKGFLEVAGDNHAFLKRYTRYLSKAEIVKAATPHFTQVAFVEQHALRFLVEKYLTGRGRDRGRGARWLLKRLPHLAPLFSTAYSRVLFLRK